MRTFPLKRLRHKINSKKYYNLHSVCIKKVHGSTNILVQINDQNIELFQKLQALSCKKFEVGDYITFDQNFDQQLFDKNLKPKTFEKENYSYILSDDGKDILKTSIEKLRFKKIETDQELAITLMFDTTAKKNMIIVERLDGHWPEIVSKKTFDLDYCIVE